MEQGQTIGEDYPCKISKTNVHYNDIINMDDAIRVKILGIVCPYVSHVFFYYVLSSIIVTMSNCEEVIYGIDLNFVLTKKDLRDDILLGNLQKTLLMD